MAMAAALLTAAGPVLAGGSVPFYERSFVLAAHERCGLFSDELGAALTVSTRQARSAALRAGTETAEVNATARRAQARAAEVACNDPELAMVADRVEMAFDGWRRIPSLSFPGLEQPWLADRRAYSQETWALSQTSQTGASPVRFGQTSVEGEMKVVVSFVGAPRPYAARVVMRDTGVMARPWLGRAGALPPAPSRRAVMAMSQAPATRMLLAADRRAGEVWSFPASLGTQLERLDPREGFWVEFLFRDGSVARAAFEVGDISAGRAFLQMGPL
jgi:hypothetical protein|tara:strand:+ start:29475 stop:30296 length:822 start_codon:yes stop_codon:yes gene_type:complete